MDFNEYEVPYYWNSEITEYYYLSRDGWLLSIINMKYNNEYTIGDGFGLTVHRYDTSIIFQL